MRCARRRRVELTETGFYRTELGRSSGSRRETTDLSVQLLKRTIWVPEPIGMVRLRLAPTTARLTAHQVRALPP
jgi:hypothetical protein